MGSGDWLTIRIPDSAHNVTIDKRRVNDLPLKATPCQIQKHDFGPVGRIGPKPAVRKRLMRLQIMHTTVPLQVEHMSAAASPYHFCRLIGVLDQDWHLCLQWYFICNQVA